MYCTVTRSQACRSGLDPESESDQSGHRSDDSQDERRSVRIRETRQTTALEYSALQHPLAAGWHTTDTAVLPALRKLRGEKTMAMNEP